MEFLSKRICRACMNEVTVNKRLYFIYDTATENEARTLAEILLSSIPGILIEFHDKLPKSICLECLETLLKFVDFQKLCLKSQNKMMALIAAPQASNSGIVSEAIIKTETLLLPETIALQGRTDMNTMQSNECFIIEEVKQDTSDGAYAEIKKEREDSIPKSIEEYSEDEFDDHEQSHIPIEGSWMEDEGSMENVNSSPQLASTKKPTMLKIEDESERFTATKYQTFESEHDSETDSATSKHVCSFCGKGFTKLRSVYEHMSRQHKYERTAGKSIESNDHRSYECPTCPQNFKFPSALHKHMRMHSGSKPFVCDECGTAFTSSKGLEQHKETHANAKPYKCNHCEKRFNFLDNLRKHQRVHTGKRAYKCKYCIKTYVHRQALVVHLSKHLGENIYRCELCPQRFPLAKDKREHFASHKNEDKETRLKNLTALKEDEAKLMENQTNNPETEKEPMVDLILDPQASAEGTQTESIKKTEYISLPETSGLQNKSDMDAFQSHECFLIEELNEEVEQDTNDSACADIKMEREYSEEEMVDSFESMENEGGQSDDTKEPMVLKFEDECEELTTPDISRNARTSKRQRRTIEIEDNQESDSIAPIHVCKSCGKGYIKRSVMLAHEQRCVNTEREKLFECPNCPRTFRKLTNLNYHKRIHTKPFACDECEASFSRPGPLKKHKLSHKISRSTEHSFECKYCDKSFSNISNLKSHERTHTGERKYKCKFCMETFTQYALLIYHLRKHLGVNVYSCELCPQRFPLARDARKHLASHKKEDKETRLKNLAALKEEEAKLLEKYKEDAQKEKPSKEKPFECDDCNKCFSTSWLLHRHELSHNRDTQDNKGKSYKCKYCDKAYTQGGNLTIHMEKYHNEFQE